MNLGAGALEEQRGDEDARGIFMQIAFAQKARDRNCNRAVPR